MDVLSESNSNDGIKDVEKAKIKLNGDMNGSLEAMEVDEDSRGSESNYNKEGSHDDDDDEASNDGSEASENKVNNGHEHSDSGGDDSRSHSENRNHKDMDDESMNSEDEDNLLNSDEEGSKNVENPSVSANSSKPESKNDSEAEVFDDTDEEGDINKPEPTKDDVVHLDSDEGGSKPNSDQTKDAEDKEKDSGSEGSDDDQKTPTKKKNEPEVLTPRRSSRTVQKPVRFGQETNPESEEMEEDEEEEEDFNEANDSDEIEEITPVDPLADPLVDKENKKIPRKIGNTTIVVNDTKRLAEIAAKNSNGQKKEPTLVIIDTNSILSGRGAVPVQMTQAAPPPPVVTPSVPPQPPALKPAYPGLPTALPAQGLYPPKPIPKPPPILPTLTDDMYVVEAPSFIVPYVYEKPPVKQFKKYLRKYLKQVKADRRREEEEDAAEEARLKKEEEEEAAKAKAEKEEEEKGKTEEGKEEDSEEKNEEKKEEDEKMEVDTEKVKVDVEEENRVEEKVEEKIKDKEDEIEEKKKLVEEEKKVVEEEKKKMVEEEKEKEKKVKDVSKKTESSSEDDSEDDDEKKKPLGTTSYFDNPLGKFFMQIGMNLVQEFVQTDLLKQQKKKQKSGKGNEDTEQAIASLKRNLQLSKENNEPYNMEQNKCDYCSFKTESKLIMAHHLETPHMRNYVYRCNFCPLEVRGPHDILFHMEAEHNIRGRLERAPAFHQCPQCPFEDNQKGKLTRHLLTCAKKFRPEKNLEPPLDWEPPAKIPRLTRKPPSMQMNANNPLYQQAMAAKNMQHPLLPKMVQGLNNPQNAMFRARPRPNFPPNAVNPAAKIMPQRTQMAPQLQRANMVYRPGTPGSQQVLVPTSYQISGNQIFQKNPAAAVKLLNQPSISITPLPRASSATASPSAVNAAQRPGASGAKTTFVICEICDGYIKDLEQLRNHMQWIHKVKIHPKMIYNRPPLNCQKCQFRFFTDQGLERHLLGSHGLVTSSMQDSANKGKDGGRCPVCGRVYQWKLLNHVARDHNMTLKPAHLSYKCTVCTATFGMYKQFENHVYSAHSVVAKRVMDNKKNGTTSASPSVRTDTANLLKPLKINDEITIIPQPSKKVNVPPNRPPPAPSSSSTRPRILQNKPHVDSVQVIDLDDSPHKLAASENGNAESLNAVKERLKRRKSLEIRQVESEQDQDRTDEDTEEEEEERPVKRAKMQEDAIDSQEKRGKDDKHEDVNDDDDDKQDENDEESEG